MYLITILVKKVHKASMSLLDINTKAKIDTL